MSKIQKISVTNFKAIGELEIDFNGCTAILTGGNNKGKSTFLRGVIDRIRGLKPELIVKQGEKEGSGTIELTTGEKFVWEFDIEGADKLTFVTKEGYKTKVTKEIVARFFPPSFDIDKFLNSPPKDQSKQLQKIVGIDFTEIDYRYKLAYDDRTEKNKEAEKHHVKLTSMLECTKVDSVDLTDLQEKKETERKRLNDLYLFNKDINSKKRIVFEEAKKAIDKITIDFNSEQITKDNLINKYKNIKENIIKILEENKIEDLVNLNQLNGFINSLPIPELSKVASELYPKEPDYIEEMPNDETLQLIDKQILEASEINTKAKAYIDYIAYKNSVEAAKADAFDADIKVKAIEEERENLIKSAKMPTGIAFGVEGITVDGFPLENSQISTSKKYCAALRIASMNLGEVEALHFDASFLDKNTMAEIEAWAEAKGFQLLIERADYEAGEIKYELIEKK